MPETTLDFDNDSPSLRVIDALADAMETDPLELEPLYNVIDPEALNQLVRADSGSTASVQFTYGDHAVEVRGNGTVAVDGTVYAHVHE